MKTKSWLLLLLLAAMTAGAQTNLNALLQQGLSDEQIFHNVPGAIADYQALASQYDKDRQMAATAIFRLGECYRLTGQTNEAAQEYERILRDFSDQTTLSTLSRQNLIGMGMASASPSAISEATYVAGIIRPQATNAAVAQNNPAPVDPEDQEIQRIQAMIQNSPDLINGKPLCDAASAGELRVATFLLDHGADVNARFQSKTPLIAAAENAQMTMVGLLLSRGADPNVHDYFGSTALLAATSNGYESVVKLLLTRGADGNEPFTGGKENNNTPLQEAVDKGFVNLVGLFLTNGVDINTTNNLDSRTPLCIAVFEGRDKITRMLLGAGADPNIADNDGKVPLSYAKSPEIIKMLLAAKADPNGGWVNAPLFSAINRNDLASAELLLQAGANPNLVGTVWNPFKSNGNSHASPLWSAVDLGELPMIQLLLKYKADVNDAQIDNESLLFRVLDNTNILEALLDAGATVDASNDVVNQRATPLEIAVSLNEVMTAAILLNHGANPNYRDLNGDTPLHYATASNNNDRDLMALLLDHHTDPNIRDSQGTTPLDYLKQKREQTADHLVSYLRERGALDVLPDWDHITVSRPSAKYSSVIFVRRTNDWNQFTLFDLLGVQYELLTASHSGTTRIIVMPYNNNSGIGNSLSFPDFTKIIIHRPSSSETNWTDLKINLAHALNIGNCSADVPLQFGDVVEIPEADHVINQPWTGLSTNELFTLKNCLTRRLQITINGQTTNVLVTPKMDEFPPGTPEYASYGYLASPSGAPIIRLDRFEPSMIWPVLEGTHLLLASSDFSQVEVKRRDSNGKMHEWIVDCSDPNSPPNFWLRDGDIIVVPEKAN